MLEAPEQGDQGVPRGQGRRQGTGGGQGDDCHQSVRAQGVVLHDEPGKLIIRRGVALWSGNVYPEGADCVLG